MSSTTTMSWTDWSGNELTREVNLVADARNLERTAGYAWVIMAANPHLSCADIENFLAEKGGGCARSLSWIKRRKWMFPLPPGSPPKRKGATPNRDGKQRRAVEIMRANHEVSARRLVYVLKSYGIVRSRQWVLKHRCDPLE